MVFSFGTGSGTHRDFWNSQQKHKSELRNGQTGLAPNFYVAAIGGSLPYSAEPAQALQLRIAGKTIWFEPFDDEEDDASKTQADVNDVKMHILVIILQYYAVIHSLWNPHGPNWQQKTQRPGGNARSPALTSVALIVSQSHGKETFMSFLERHWLPLVRSIDCRSCCRLAVADWYQCRACDARLYRIRV